MEREKGSKAGKTKLIVLRHGETDWNLEKRIQGQRDVSINEKGKLQIREACEHLAKMEIHLIVASPLLRAVESAQICARELGLPIRAHPAFSERSFGWLEGQTAGEIARKYGILDVEEIEDPVKGIESFQSVGNRVDQGLLELTLQFPGQTILLVTHGSIIKYMGHKRGLDIGIVKNGTYLEMLVSSQEEAVICRRES